MKQLRTRLLEAKEEYQQVRYPGDLMADLQHRHVVRSACRLPIRRWLLRGTVAAAVALLLCLGFIAANHPSANHAQPSPLPTGTALSPATLGIWPAVALPSIPVSETPGVALDLQCIPAISLPAFSLQPSLETGRNSPSTETSL